MTPPTPNPPAPDWTQGEDGHWRPPPTSPAGSARTPPSAPWGPSQDGGQGQVPADQADATGAGPVPPGFGYGYGPPSGAPAYPPPGPQASTAATAGKVVAVMVGSAVVIGGAIVGVLLMAVTFLGTTPSDGEPRFVTVGSAPPVATRPQAGSSDRPGPSNRQEVARENSESASERAVAEVTRLIEDAELLDTGGELVAEGAISTYRGPDCMPEGWNDGTVESYGAQLFVDFQFAGDLTVTSYMADAQAQADLMRAGSAEAQDCVVSTSTSHGPNSEVETLPSDAVVPGVIHRVGPDSDSAEDYAFIFVGRLRAEVAFCPCDLIDEAGRAALTIEIARGMATVQGLPEPG